VANGAIITGIFEKICLYIFFCDSVICSEVNLLDGFIILMLSKLVLIDSLFMS
jgi:hypothetical protein